MSEVIDLGVMRNQREAPDPENVRRDEYGRPLYRFMAEYEMGRDRYGIDIWAYDQSDAENKVVAIRKGLVLSGQLFTSVDA